jgi:hypothetical protein
MRITVDLRRPARRSVALVLGVLLLAVPGAALATHQFYDVPTGNPFHNDIAAVAEAGITAGFGDSGFHPSDTVTRQAMAAFLHRGLGRVGLSIGPTGLVTSSFVVQPTFAYSTKYVVRQITIEVPGATNTFTPNQQVHVQGRAVIWNLYAAGCPCEFGAVIRDVDTNAESYFQLQTFEADVVTPHKHSFDIDALWSVAPGPHTYALVVFLNDRDDALSSATYRPDASSSLAVTTYPFGPSGTDDI